MKFRYYLLALALLTLVGGCGFKTLPVPPGAVIPSAINDLTCTLDEKGIELTWTYPAKSVQGTSIDTIRVFKVFRAQASLEDFCPGCPVRYELIVEMDASRFAAKDRLRFVDSNLQNDYHYTYMVQSHSGWNIQSPDSNRLSLDWYSPAPAPENVQIEVGDRLLTLRWAVPASMADGSSIQDVSYQLMRSVADKDFKVLAPGVSETFFVDGTVANGQLYSYNIRILRQLNGIIYPGQPSRIVFATPQDKTPPAPPRQVDCMAGSDGIKIVWQVSAEEDLAGYRIYRRSADSKTPVMIGEIGLAWHIFTDVNLPGGDAVWYYSVTTIDRAEPPNESVSSMEVKFDRRIN